MELEFDQVILDTNDLQKSQIIESATYCNQIVLVPLHLRNKQKLPVNIIMVGSAQSDPKNGNHSGWIHLYQLVDKSFW